MIVSPAQAREKWCPMARNIIVSPVNMTPPHSRLIAVDNNGKAENTSVQACVADGCMFWQWVGFRPQSAPEKFTHRELLDAGVDPGALVKGREITLPPMQPQYAALSGMAARVSNVWRDGATKECFVSLDIIGGDERVGRCGLCQPEAVAV